MTQCILLYMCLALRPVCLCCDVFSQSLPYALCKRHLNGDYKKGLGWISTAALKAVSLNNLTIDLEL
jgi:hypothetical protein